MAYTRQIGGRWYRYCYNTRRRREVYCGAVKPAQSKKDVLYTLDDEVAESMAERFVRGYTFADIRKYLQMHGIKCCDATIRKYMKDNYIQRYMY